MAHGTLVDNRDKEGSDGSYIHYMVTTYLHGVPVSDIIDSFTHEQKKSYAKELGQIIGEVHQLVPETVEHFLCDCPVYDVFRYNVSVPLSQWLVGLSPQLILSYPSRPIPVTHRKYIHSLMSNFLLTTRKIRKC